MRLPDTRLDNGMFWSIVPLFDTVFQLLVCFVCTASFSMPELALATTPPTAAAVQYRSSKEIEELGLVHISLSQRADELRIELNGNPVAGVASLLDRLRLLRSVADVPAV